MNLNQGDLFTMADKEQKEESSDSKGAPKAGKQHWEKTSDLPLEERQRRGNYVLKKLFSMKKIPMAPDAD